jgi:hypothetical protein
LPLPFALTLAFKAAHLSHPASISASSSDGIVVPLSPGKAKMLRTLALLLVITAAGSTSALAQLPLPPLPFSLFEQGTPQERAACQGDVQKYCESALPNVMQVAQCLQINRQKISSACRQVLVNRGL